MIFIQARITRNYTDYVVTLCNDISKNREIRVVRA